MSDMQFFCETNQRARCLSDPIIYAMRSQRIPRLPTASTPAYGSMKLPTALDGYHRDKPWTDPQLKGSLSPNFGREEGRMLRPSPFLMEPHPALLCSWRGESTASPRRAHACTIPETHLTRMAWEIWEGWASRRASRDRRPTPDALPHCSRPHQLHR